MFQPFLRLLLNVAGVLIVALFAYGMVCALLGTFKPVGGDSDIFSVSFPVGLFLFRRVWRRVWRFPAPHNFLKWVIA